MTTNTDKVAAIYTVLPKLIRGRHDLLVNGFEPHGVRLWEGWKPDPEEDTPGFRPAEMETLGDLRDRIIGLPIEWVDEVCAYVFSKDEVSEIRYEV